MGHWWLNDLQHSLKVSIRQQHYIITLPEWMTNTTCICHSFWWCYNVLCTLSFRLFVYSVPERHFLIWNTSMAKWSVRRWARCVMPLPRCTSELLPIFKWCLRNKLNEYKHKIYCYILLYFQKFLNVGVISLSLCHFTFVWLNLTDRYIAFILVLIRRGCSGTLCIILSLRKHKSP